VHVVIHLVEGASIGIGIGLILRPVLDAFVEWRYARSFQEPTSDRPTHKMAQRP
jgi:hypothetical protein